MQNRVFGMFGAAVVATLGSSQIAAAAPDPADVFSSRSFAEAPLPIPNATVVLGAAELTSVTGYEPVIGDRDTMSNDRDRHRHWRHRRHD